MWCTCSYVFSSLSQGWLRGSIQSRSRAFSGAAGMWKVGFSFHWELRILSWGTSSSWQQQQTWTWYWQRVEAKEHDHSWARKSVGKRFVWWKFRSAILNFQICLGKDPTYSWGTSGSIGWCLQLMLIASPSWKTTNIFTAQIKNNENVCDCPVWQ